MSTAPPVPHRWSQRLGAAFHRMGLQAQLLWSMGLLLLPVFAVFITWAGYEAAWSMRARLETQAQNLSRSLALSAAAAIDSTQTEEHLELALRQEAYSPEMLRLSITDARGVSMAEILPYGKGVHFSRAPVPWSPPSAQLGAHASRSLQSAAAVGEKALSALIEDRDDRVIAWMPVASQRVLGWVRVELDARATQAARLETLRTWSLGSLALLAFILLGLNILLRRSLEPLRRAAHFAVRLPRAVGTTLNDEQGSRETRELRHALNFASLQLHHQYQRQSEHVAQLDTITELSTDGFAVIDVQGALAYANPAFRLMTGCAFQGESLAALIETLGGRLVAGTPALVPGTWLDGKTHEYTLPFAEPAHMVLQLTVRPGVGQYRHLLYLRDVSREAAVDRMKSEFLATAAHELRTPMVSIFGYTELMLKRQLKDEQRRDMLEVVHRQTQRLIELVNDLLDLARIESRQGADFRRSDQAITQILKEAIETIVVPGGKHSVRVEAAESLPWVSVDEHQIGRALNNLLSNAVKYWPDGGEIVVKLTHASRKGVPGLSLAVCDGGMGMTPQQVARVFERFFRADQACHIPGTGLGLSLVKEIVQLHGGEISVESALGEGSTFTVWLPASIGLVQANPASPQALTPA